jgi:malonyl-CoA O-methyltransferase
MLHWLPQPYEALQHWQNWLQPEARLYVALLTEGSFKEWRDLCRIAGLKDGLWPMPPANFAHDLAAHTKQEIISISYPTAGDFLHRLKSTGAATPRQGHMPFSIPMMRRLMTNAPRPFTISYEILYLELKAISDS